MRWAYSVKNKLTASLLLLVVVGVVLLNNFKEKHQSSQIRVAIDSIYEDRLVVEGYIYEFTRILYDIRSTIAMAGLEKGDLNSCIEMKISEMEELIALYEDTYLTEDEAQYLTHFTALAAQMKEGLKQQQYSNIESHIGNALNDLHALSEIQMEEGGLIIKKTDKLLNAGNIMSQFEMAILIVILLVIYGLIFSSKPMLSKSIKQQIGLN